MFDNMKCGQTDPELPGLSEMQTYGNLNFNHFVRFCLEMTNILIFRLSLHSHPLHFKLCQYGFKQRIQKESRRTVRP